MDDLWKGWNEKTLRNGLCISETDTLNYKGLDFVILLGLALH